MESRRIVIMSFVACFFAVFFGLGSFLSRLLNPATADSSASALVASLAIPCMLLAFVGFRTAQSLKKLGERVSRLEQQLGNRHTDVGDRVEPPSAR